MARRGNFGFAPMAVVCAVLAFVFYAPKAAAQDAAAPVSSILLLDREELYNRSQFGENLRAELTLLSAEVEAETRRLESELEAEERALTQRRSEMLPEKFAPLAAEFDAKVQRLRAENAAATDDLRGREVAGRQRFFEAAEQVIRDHMIERGAVAIIDKSAVIANLTALDATDEVVAKLDEVLGNGASAPP